MSGWYSEGTEVVFSCGGGIYLSACAAAEEAGAKVIGVDVDQYYVSDTVITSAMKELKHSVVLALTDLYANDCVWPEAYAGTTATLGAADNCVGLPTADTSWRSEQLHRGRVRAAVRGHQVRRNRCFQRHHRGPRCDQFHRGLSGIISRFSEGPGNCPAPRDADGTFSDASHTEQIEFFPAAGRLINGARPRSGEEWSHERLCH